MVKYSNSGQPPTNSAVRCGRESVCKSLPLLCHTVVALLSATTVWHERKRDAESNHCVA